MGFQQDRDEVTYEEYEFVPMAPMDNASIPEEMKEFMSMCCMMGMMPMNNLINPMERSFSLGGITPFMGKATSVIEDQSMWKEDNIYTHVNAMIEERDSNCEERRSLPKYKGLEYYNSNYSRLDRIVEKIEKNNPGIYRFLEMNGIKYERARKLVRRIARLSLMYFE